MKLTNNYYPMKRTLLSFLLMGGLSTYVYAQENLTYQLPPKSIVDLVDAPGSPTVQFNKDGSLMLLLQAPGYASIEQVAQPVIGLAGIRINPANNSTEGELSGVYNGLTIKDLKTGKENKLSGLPEKLRMTNISWNADGSFFAFTNNALNGVELWLADVKNLKATRLSDGYLNDAYGTTLQWHPDGKHILAQFILPERGIKPVENIVPTGPVVQQNLGVVTPSRTYQNLLKNTYDQSLMEYYLTSQLQSVDLSGNAVKIGSPAIYRKAAYSPDGQYLMTQTVEKPYSYLVPIYYFPFQTTVLDATGKLVKQLYNAPLAEKLPTGFDAVAMGPRSYEWRSDAAATVVWAEAQDKGDPNLKSELRDVLYTLKAPFTAEPVKLFSMALRYSDVVWGNQNYALVKEQWRKDRKEKMTLINPETGKTVKEIANRSSEDTYTDPGDFIFGKGPYAAKVLLFDKGAAGVVFTKGAGASSLGDRPFILKWNLLSNKQDTLFKSKSPYYEEPVFFNNTGKVYISRESTEETPNIFAINLKNKSEQALTSFSDPYPSLKGVQKTLLSYPRKDGIKLSATLYLPKDYKKESGPLPVLIWAYPREFKSLAAAGQVKGSPYRFTRLAFRSPVFWVTRGYAVLDQADMPIVGEGKEEPNDTFLKQIEDNATALINYVVDMGVADRGRIGVGGHSYGAFMTANLLAHTKLFAAGIARSGAYNRTLTPFGFQGEARTYWQAMDVYNKMSPFNYADKIKTPLLMTHGIDDENSGTFPIQSERLYSAIKGHGGTVRLVLLPKEFHGYRSRESILHTFWEQDQWLEKYVKNKK
ncbi:alpha/beta hydrolase family protein [Pedobacter caeni]|uniref:Glutamyl peptidase. Serine peptidase. MEROPS family S09D n=1 Tax=Pedobacter caeni TaxID=288992 RepID=A0A1M4VYW5_9SPHI|nr:prolyl oligopeptidase family serine peptidase [Pedobacter caeni]SHE73902.1 glutamyl peptidase. Serine peptidase. MEROPS family S09D [Pedobacter caeni]